VSVCKALLRRFTTFHVLDAVKDGCDCPTARGTHQTKTRADQTFSGDTQVLFETSVGSLEKVAQKKIRYLDKIKFRVSRPDGFENEVKESLLH
jgi:hypothetical protein